MDGRVSERSEDINKSSSSLLSGFNRVVEAVRENNEMKWKDKMDTYSEVTTTAMDNQDEPDELEEKNTN